MPTIQNGRLAGRSFVMSQITEGSSETMSFLTDIQTSHNGTEGRRQLRETPRHAQKLVQFLSTVSARDARQLFDQNIRGQWALPFWMQSVYVGNVSGNSVFFTATDYDYFVGGSALIFNEMGVWKVVDVTSVETEGLIFEQSVGFMESAYVCPIYDAIVEGDVSLGFESGGDIIESNLVVKNSQPIISKFGISIVLDAGGGSDALLEYRPRFWPQAIRILHDLSDYVLLESVSIDLHIALISASTQQLQFINASREDILSAIVFIENFGAQGLTERGLAYKAVREFFQQFAPNDGTRKDYAFVFLDRQEFFGNELIDSADLFSSSGNFKFPKNVEITAGNMSENVTEFLDLVHTAQFGDPIQYADFENNGEIYRRFWNVVSSHMWQFHAGLPVNTSPSVSDSNSNAISVGQFDNRVDYDIGVFQERSPWEFSRRAAGHRFVMENQQERNIFRRSINRLSGRANAFYQPSFQFDLKIIDIENDKIVTNINPLIDFSNPPSDLAMLDVFKNWRFYRIDLIESGPNNTLHLSMSEDIFVLPKDIRLASFMTISRFADDDFEISYVGNGFMQSDLSVVGLA